MKRRTVWLLDLLVLGCGGFLFGCVSGPIFPLEVLKKVDRTVRFEQVEKDPAKYKDRIVEFGGQIVGSMVEVEEVHLLVRELPIQVKPVYGPADHEFLPALLPMARMGIVFKTGFGPKYYSLVHVDDLCEGILAAAEKGKTLSSEDPSQGVYFLSDGEEYSYQRFCDALAAALGKPPPRIIPVPEVASYAAVLGARVQAALSGSVAMISLDKLRELRCEAWTCSNNRARKEIEYRPTVPLDTGLRQTIDWYRQEGWI